ncbi:hypothetical protein [Prescottella subtropica]|uniref:hypothetical protein n=1 Tax=Prescottella subtropica TaxID=2545757 RepID=UPI0010F4946F|nr:hypothetical protein [Prescottella subtropica]
MKLIGWAVVALVVIGIAKGTIDVDLSSGGNAASEIVASLLSGIRDTTVMLIPNIIDGVKGMLDKVPDAESAVTAAQFAAFP